MDDDEIEAALARLDGPGVSREECFPLGRALHTQRRKDSLKSAARRAARRFIEPANADEVVTALPAREGDVTHGVVPGDFVFCDIVPRVIAKHGCPPRLDLATLSMSEDNVNTLLGVLNRPEQPAMSLLASVYFWETNQSIARAVETRLVPHPRFRAATGRQHTKLMIFDYPDKAWVIAGSANLRSSNCYEQFAIFAERDVLNFYRAWMEKFHARAAIQSQQQLVPSL
jgi:hypothetical protein